MVVENIYTVIPIYFYKCLKLRFNKINKKILKYISGIILLLPTFRASSIWPDPFLFGTVFFIIGTYYFLKFKTCQKKEAYMKFMTINTIMIAFSSYISLNFIPFAFYFFINFFIKIKFDKKLFIILFLNLILAMPAFYYFFILKINFLISDTGAWDIGSNFLSLNNLSNKLIIKS